MPKRTLILIALALGVALVAPPAGARIEAPKPAAATKADVHRARVTFHRRAVATGLAFPAAFTFSPAGRVWYGERFTGEIRIIDPAAHTNHLFFPIQHVATDGEQGLLGLALDPNFKQGQPFVYAYATRNVNGSLHDQILRIRNVNGHGQNPVVIWSSATTAGTYHDGGHILFGPDGFLYAMQGEAHDSGNAQDKSNDAGKVLRMTRDGDPAPGNPFAGKRIWSFGHRNSFGMAFDPATGRLWETENGPECNDELNRIVKGGNFAWGPNENCNGQSPQDTNNSGPSPRHLPLRWYTPTIAPTGIVFCHQCGLGSGSEGRMFFGAYNTHEIRRLTLTSNRLGIVSQSVVFTNTSGILSMEHGPHGALYFSDGSGIFRLVRS
jgi:aldose sugar dehydrogenase